MSAPKNAKPLGYKDWEVAGKKLTESQARIEAKKTKWECECGAKGDLGELLGTDDDDDQTLWCPRCRTIGWIWA